MDPREMLARLNPTNVRFDVGRGGGRSEFQNIDVAHGLGKVSPGLGKEVLIACWWPDGAAQRGKQFAKEVTDLVRGELVRQGERLVAAHLDLQVAQAAVLFSGRPKSPEQRAEISKLENELERVRAKTWPKNAVEHLPAIAKAVVTEMSRAHLCECCDGHQTIVADGLVAPCAECRGTGLERAPDRRRAIAIGCDPSDYGRRWKVVYEWVMDELREAEQIAARELRKELAA